MTIIDDDLPMAEDEELIPTRTTLQDLAISFLEGLAKDDLSGAVPLLDCLQEYGRTEDAREIRLILADAVQSLRAKNLSIYVWESMKNRIRAILYFDIKDILSELSWLEGNLDKVLKPKNLIGTTITGPSTVQFIGTTSFTAMSANPYLGNSNAPRW